MLAEAEAGKGLLQQRRIVDEGRSAQLGAGSTTEAFEVSGRWQRARGNAEVGEGDAVELGEVKRSSGGAEGTRTGKSRLA